MNKLEWEEKYSVGVEVIDRQHKKLFELINRLIEMLSEMPTQEQIDGILKEIIEYKLIHFGTEEKYFDEFNYEYKEEHKEKHREFSDKIEEMKTESNGNSITLAYRLVDYLEDWLINHLMNEDQKYVSCFREHGLK